MLTFLLSDKQPKKFLQLSQSLAEVDGKKDVDAWDWNVTISEHHNPQIVIFNFFLLLLL
jgi:hypothetical protein